MQTWRIRLFAYLREDHGETIEVSAEPTVNGIFAALSQRGINIKAARLAVNQEFATKDQAIFAGDELALIPPVSGG